MNDQELEVEFFVHDLQAIEQQRPGRWAEN